MHRDLVCGKTVTGDNPIATTYRDFRFVFCSLYCKQAFEQAPEHYIDEAHRQGETELPTRSMVDGPAPIWSSSGTPTL
jgi:YHS domain-containing protein